MKNLTNEEFSKEIGYLRAHLEPVLNQRYKELLIEAEKRLNGVVSTNLANFLSKGPQQGRRLTKAVRMQKYL